MRYSILPTVLLLGVWITGFQQVWAESPALQSSVSTGAGNGPYLANGTRNSWADQDSIVIWTRTTRDATMISDGPDFKRVPAKLEAEIRRSGEIDRYVWEQLPDGKLLHEMLGACPGMSGEVRLTYFPEDEPEAREVTPWKQTRLENDYTVQWELAGLPAGMKFVTKVEARAVGADTVSAVSVGSFQTAPSADQPAAVRFCMTTCHDFLRRDDGLVGHKIYPSMTALEPDFVVHAGDIEYYDKPQPFAWTKELMRFKWARIFSMPRNRDFYSTHTTYFIKDDHDTLKNDSWTGQVYGNVSFEEGVRLFNQEQFPSRDPRYATTRWGKDLQIWILEGRDYRSPNNMPDGPEKTILGNQQKQWLKQTLAESTAAFKLVFSPTPIVGPDRANKKDNHSNVVFDYEGNELRDYFATIDGIVLFCGDRHWQYASVDDQTGLWEFGCGPGSEKHQLGWKPGDVRPEHQFLRVAGGFLSGRVAREKGIPQLLIRHRTVDGEQVSEFKFSREAE